MANSTKRSHSGICPDCNGNGYVQCHIEEGREHIVLQCNTCDSEGEIYVDESEVIESYIDADLTPDDDVSVH
jgi:transcription elongation factor Elf1